MKKGLMEMEGPMHEQDEGPEVEATEKSGAELDASLVYEVAMHLLSKPEARQQVVTAVSQASDVGTAIGKMAGILVSKISDELEARGMPIDDESLLGSSGGLARVLTAIYQTVNEEGLELAMEDSLIQAYEVAEADYENMLSGGGQPQEAPQGMPPQAPQGAGPLMEAV